ncbi:DUF2075 domain-containing protein [Clostridium sp. MB40-C1]|uniref:DNA/RNA helicase domain-containing protein n=1 Tax=Clostridium sp. MB40-C1 TaxID=3070996 RepID=UPI0027E1F312|nr:DNA/RNA helicase domain-containing protein [Clostridium sp. MB40-C1]WMJ81441.1 DUF2075 domain-containing protein [Clostridium sp. MB40-C1]
MGWTCLEKFKSDESVDSEANIYRINIYRVLLTRGRDGFIAFVPPTEEFQSVYDALVNAGVEVL